MHSMCVSLCSNVSSSWCHVLACVLFLIILAHYSDIRSKSTCISTHQALVGHVVTIYIIIMCFYFVINGFRVEAFMGSS